MDIDTNVDYCSLCDLLFACGSHMRGNIDIPSMLGESTVCKLGGHFILSV